MLRLPLFLCKTNYELAKHVRKSWLYTLVICICCLFIIAVILLDFFFQNTSDEVYKKTFLSIVYFVAMFDFLALILRVQSRSLIEPRHLLPFPFSKWKRFQFHFLLFFLDHKSIIYISAMLSSLAVFLVYGSYVEVISSVLIWSIMLTTILTWTTVIYILFGKYLDRFKNKVQYIGLFIVAIYLIIGEIGNEIFEKIPVIKQVGNALYGLWISSPDVVWNNLLLLLGSLAFPLLLLTGIWRVNKSL